ncbi:MAG: DUF2508 family protein [Oscillospiraceae bacterium]|nr:DUF2508 family protein [Oscillospiraceae bacterium]
MVNKIFFFKNRKTKDDLKRTEEEKNRRQLLDDIENCVIKINKVRERYDLVCEDELIEALIYEEKALYARYSYLLRTAREQGIQCHITLKNGDI